MKRMGRPFSAKDSESRNRVSDLAVIAIRSREAWDMRYIQHLPLDEIAGKFGCSMERVRDMLRKVSPEIRQEFDPKFRTYFEEQVGKLEVLQEKLWQRVLDSEVAGRLDTVAVAEYRKLSESLRRLLGIDRNKDKLEITGADGGAVKLQAVAANIAEYAKNRRAQRQIEATKEADQA